MRPHCFASFPAGPILPSRLSAPIYTPGTHRSRPLSLSPYPRSEASRSVPRNPGMERKPRLVGDTGALLARVQAFRRAAAAEDSFALFVLTMIQCERLTRRCLCGRLCFCSAAGCARRR